jgi:hypothetical protein
MSRNNAVTSILVTSGDSAPLAAGATIDTLSPGQIGVFDANTKLSVDGSANVRDIFIAVGVDKTGSATLEDIVTSAGQKIQVKNVVGYNFREHSAAQPQIALISDYVGKCGYDYTFKVEFRNQQIYRTQGFNQFTKPYSFRTDSCTGCEDCPSGDANEVTLKLLNAIAQDIDGLLTAVPVARQALTIITHGTSANYAAGEVMSVADVEAILAYNAGEANEALHVFSDVQVTSVPLAVNDYCKVNLLYFHPRQTIMIPSVVDGFGTETNVTVTQEAAFEEGNGYDIAQKEFHAAGNQQNKPYVISDSTGVPISYDIFADKSEKYDQFTLEYDLKSSAGWLEYENNLRTVIAIPNQDTATRDGLAAILDGLLGQATVGFDALADDAAAADTGDTVVSPTTDIDDVTLDGQA